MDIHQFGRGATTATAVGVLTVVVAGAGVAAAANGGTLSLGHHNHATKTTTLIDKKTPPLSLVTKKGKPPLKVNSSGLVKHLNAGLLGGKTASQLTTTASAAAGELVIDGSHLPTVVALPMPSAGPSTVILSPVLIASTGTLKPASYVVTAQAYAASAVCWVDTAPNPGKPHEFGISDSSASSATVTTALTLTSAHTINLYCSDINSAADSGVASAGITAVRVASVSKGHATPGTLSDAARYRP